MQRKNTYIDSSSASNNRLAEILGLNAETVRRFRLGKRRPSKRFLSALDTFDKNLAELVPDFDCSLYRDKKRPAKIRVDGKDYAVKTAKVRIPKKVRNMCPVKNFREVPLPPHLQKVRVKKKILESFKTLSLDAQNAVGEEPRTTFPVAPHLRVRDVRVEAIMQTIGSLNKLVADLPSSVDVYDDLPYSSETAAAFARMVISEAAAIRQTADDLKAQASALLGDCVR